MHFILSRPIRFDAPAVGQRSYYTFFSAVSVPGSANFEYPGDTLIIALVTAMYTYENLGRILAFKLNGGKTPLPPKVTGIATPAPPETALKNELVAGGMSMYYTYCESCHGGFGEEHLSQHPDLSKMQPATHQTFQDIVPGGRLSSSGMASFRKALKKSDVEAIHHFLLMQQKNNYKTENELRTK